MFLFSYLHAKSIIHRDLKSNSILSQRCDCGTWQHSWLGFFAARNELTDVKSCSCVNICWVEISLRRDNTTGSKVRNTYYCNNVASCVVVSQRFLHRLVSTCNERLCQFTHGIFSSSCTWHFKKVLGISRKPPGPWSVQHWPSHFLCNPSVP